MLYYRFLTERGPGAASQKLGRNVTSATIAEALDVDPTQVRKDFSAVGLMGMGRVGFDVDEARYAICHALGFDRRHEAVLIGTGHLGRALLAYNGFARYGLDIVGVFDNDTRKIGGKAAGHTVQSTRGLKAFIRKNGIRLAILTTPVTASQKIADRLVSVGIMAIWNFTPTRLVVPYGVMVRNEHISLGLSQIAHHLARLGDGGYPRGKGR
jgi:redox-sensing transcriptional repressor